MGARGAATCWPDGADNKEACRKKGTNTFCTLNTKLGAFLKKSILCPCFIFFFQRATRGKIIYFSKHILKNHHLMPSCSIHITPRNLISLLKLGSIHLYNPLRLPTSEMSPILHVITSGSLSGALLPPLANRQTIITINQTGCECSIILLSSSR